MIRVRLVEFLYNDKCWVLIFLGLKKIVKNFYFCLFDIVRVICLCGEEEIVV